MRERVERRKRWARLDLHELHHRDEAGPAERVGWVGDVEWFVFRAELGLRDVDTRESALGDGGYRKRLRASQRKSNPRSARLTLNCPRFANPYLATIFLYAFPNMRIFHPPRLYSGLISLVADAPKVRALRPSNCISRITWPRRPSEVPPGASGWRGEEVGARGRGEDKRGVSNKLEPNLAEPSRRTKVTACLIWYESCAICARMQMATIFCGRANGEKVSWVPEEEEGGRTLCSSRARK